MAEHIYCSVCEAHDHHTIECMTGENIVNYGVMPFSLQEDSRTTTTQDDASSRSDLINLEESVVCSDASTSHTDYHDDLKEVFLNQQKPSLYCELSPITPNYEARFKEDLEEAIRRSLTSAEGVNSNTKVEASDGYSNKEGQARAINSELLLSEDEDFETLKKTSTDKVLKWDEGDENNGDGSNAQVASQQESGYDSDQWVIRLTPKTLQNIKNKRFRRLTLVSQSSADTGINLDKTPVKSEEAKDELPKSSFLALEDTSPAKKRGGRAKGNWRTYAEAVTRTVNTDNNTMTVSSLRKKRQGRGNKQSYYDITPELQYLR